MVVRLSIFKDLLGAAPANNISIAKKPEIYPRLGPLVEQEFHPSRTFHGERAVAWQIALIEAGIDEQEKGESLLFSVISASERPENDKLSGLLRMLPVEVNRPLAIELLEIYSSEKTSGCSRSEIVDLMIAYNAPERMRQQFRQDTPREAERPLTDVEMGVSLSGFSLYDGLPVYPVKRKVMKRERAIVFSILILAILSPFVALGILGGMSLARFISLRNRTRSEVICDLGILGIAIIALAIQPLTQKILIEQRDKAFGALQDIIDGRQIDLRIPSFDGDILVRDVEIDFMRDLRQI